MAKKSKSRKNRLRVLRVVDAATEKCKGAPPPPADILCTDVYADGGFAWRN